MAFCSSQACQDDAPDGTPGMPSTPDMDGTNRGGPEDMGPDMDGAGAGEPGTGTSGEGVPTPSLDGNEGQGGAASDGTGGPADMPVATGGAGVEPGAPGFEQDDPNLHPPDTSYDRVEIPADVTNVMSIDIDDQDRVYVLERTGGLKIWYPAEQRVVDAGSIPVFSGNEDGALNIRLDPGFSTNGWAYIYYSSTLANENVLARFDIANDVLDRASEKVLLRVPDQREERYHVAGGMDFLEFIRNRMAEVRTDDDGNIVAVDDLFSSFTWNSMIQARISPSGVLHVAQFGGASTVYRMNYVGNGQ